MLKIKLKSGGHIVEIGKSFPCRLISASGLDGCDFDIGLSSSALYDGGYISKSRIQPREIDLSFDMPNDEGLRRQMIKLFTPHNDVEITVSRFDVKRQIVGRVSACSIKQSSIFDIQTVSLSLICPDPYFYDADDTSVSFSGISGLIHLGLPLPSSGIALGVKNERDRVSVINSGDAQCGFDMSIAITSPVTYISVINTLTDEFVKLTHAFSIGDSISICTAAGKKEVLCNGTSCLQYMDSSSVFFSLKQGETPIKIVTSKQSIAFDACIGYRQMYLGV